MSGLTTEVGSLLGGGNNNSQFTAATPSIMVPTTTAQAGTAYNTAQNTLQQQQTLATALQGQTTQGAANQTSLAQALQAQAAGQGPNPAAAQLAQATGANVSNQAALMAGQRGASSNVGLIARQAAQQGAATQQNAVGQAATLQAQQQLAAQGQLQNLSANQVAQGTGQTNATAQASQNEQGLLLNSINAENNASVAATSNMNNVNGAMAQTNANNAANATGGLINGLGGVGAASGMFGSGAAGAQAAGNLFAKGGEVKANDPTPNKKLSKVAKKDRLPLPAHIKGMADIFHTKHFADGGNVDNIQIDEGSPDAIPDAAQKAGGGGGGIGSLVGLAALAASKGAIVPGEPKVNKNDTKNDVVPALLTPKEIVLPLSVTQAEDAPAAAAKFVAALQAEHGKGGKERDDFKKALKSAISSRKK